MTARRAELTAVDDLPWLRPTCSGLCTPTAHTLRCDMGIAHDIEPADQPEWRP